MGQWGLGGEAEREQEEKSQCLFVALPVAFSQQGKAVLPTPFPP